MNIESLILKEYSKQQVVNIASWIGSDPVRFAMLMRVMLNSSADTVHRSSWIVSYCAEQHPELIVPWIRTLLTMAGRHDTHHAVRRNVMRSFQFITIPKRDRGRAVNLCFDFLSSPSFPVAVKAFSITVLANIAQLEPDMKNEVVTVIQQMLPYGSAGIQSRAKKVLRRLSP